MVSNGTRPPGVALTRDQAWDILHDLRTTSELAAPDMIRVWRSEVRIQIEENERGHADVWASALGLPPMQLDLSYHYNAGKPFASYQYVTNGASMLLPGYGSVQVDCMVRSKVDASEHWSGLVLPPTEHRAGTPDLHFGLWRVPCTAGHWMSGWHPDEAGALAEYAAHAGLALRRDLVEAAGR